MLFYCKVTAEAYLQSFCREITTWNKNTINSLKLLFHWKFTAKDYLQSFCSEITTFNKTHINFWKLLFHCKSTAGDYLQSFCSEITTFNKTQINFSKIVISLQIHCRRLLTIFLQWNNNLKQESNEFFESLFLLVFSLAKWGNSWIN